MFCFLLACFALCVREKESDASQAQLEELQKLLERRNLREMVKHELKAHLKEMQVTKSDIKRADNIRFIEDEIRQIQEQLLALRRLVGPKKSRKK